MLIHFDFASGVPLYRQLRDQIVLGLAEGRLAPGESSRRCACSPRRAASTP